MNKKTLNPSREMKAAIDTAKLKLNPITDRNEILKVAANMVKHGGGFVQLLGRALYKADPVNVEKIKGAWPEYWKEYKPIFCNLSEN